MTYVQATQQLNGMSLEEDADLAPDTVINLEEEDLLEEEISSYEPVPMVDDLLSSSHMSSPPDSPLTPLPASPSPSIDLPDILEEEHEHEPLYRFLIPSGPDVALKDIFSAWARVLVTLLPGLKTARWISRVCGHNPDSFPCTEDLPA